MDLKVPLETVCRLIARARELETDLDNIHADEEEDGDEAEDEFAVLDDDDDDEIEAEVRVLLDDLGDDQLAEILALAWVGRGTYDSSEWDEALEEASDPNADDLIDQILDLPTLSAYLDAGLAAFDLSCDGPAD